MSTLLLIVIYILFIGLGIPDSLFGAAWPAIYREFHLPISAANAVTLLVSGGTVVSSLLSARVINRFGTAKVTAVSTLLTAVALLGYSCAGNLYWLCLFAIPLGLGAGSIDSALNNYVALHYKATHMNFLHCFYGVGVSLSPYFLSMSMSGESSWRGGYDAVFVIQISIALLAFISLPLWKRANQNTQDATEEEPQPPKNLRIAEMLKMPALRKTWCIFIGSCGIECTCGVWGSTFLVNSKGFSVDSAAEIIIFYYLGMTLGRFLSGVLAVRLSSWRLIGAGQCVLAAAVLLLFLPLPPVVSGFGLFLIGLGNGPLFPNLLHLTPENFGRDLSQSIMGSQMAVSYLGIMLLPPLFGLIAQALGTNVLPLYLLALFLIMTVSTVLLRQNLKKTSAKLETGGEQNG